jgi:hypothetical protein
MASTYPPPRQPEHPRPDQECDIGELDVLKCEAEGIKRQAAYTAEHEADLQRRRTEFDGARTAYADARAAAHADVKELRHRLSRILEQLKCQIDDDEVIGCLDRAWEEVHERLRACGEPAGCCIDDDCDFDTRCDDVSTEELLARIADIERRVKAAEACFDELIQEPAKLTARVAKLKQDVEALAAAIADPKTADYRQAYATALWAWQRLRDIWLGFEHANEYHDCLCQGLMCSLRGRKALAVLEGELAVRTCREDAEKARCTWLREHVVEEILATYLKICPPRPYREREEEPGATATA